MTLSKLLFFVTNPYLFLVPAVSFSVQYDEDGYMVDSYFDEDDEDLEEDDADFDDDDEDDEEVEGWE